MISLRNRTTGWILAQVTFTGFPATVTLFNPSMPVNIGPGATISALRVGHGTNSEISNRTVARVVDFPAGPGATVRLTNCRLI